MNMCVVDHAFLCIACFCIAVWVYEDCRASLECSGQVSGLGGMLVCRCCGVSLCIPS